jgi:RHS repeat-associated protein
MVREYGFRPNSLWTTDPLFQRYNDSYYFYQNDHLGTPRKIISVNGLIVWVAKYNVYGKANITAFSTIKNNLRFGGQYSDDETRLYYNWERYYDPRYGRYITTDSYFSPKETNLYKYSNPTGSVDPTGEWFQEIIRYRFWIELSYDISDAIADLYNRKRRGEIKRLIDNNRKAAEVAKEIREETCETDHKNCLNNNKGCEGICHEKYKECIRKASEKYYRDLRENVWPYEKLYESLRY